MLGLVRSTRYANEPASPRRKHPSREAGSCIGSLSAGQLSALTLVILSLSGMTLKADWVDAPPAASTCHSRGFMTPLKEASVSKIATTGLDIAENSFTRMVPISAA